MIYLLESIDRVGKSTLADLISKELKCKIFHDKYKPFYLTDNSILENNHDLFNELLNVKFNALIQALSLFDNIVVDRFHITEFVYNLFRDQPFNGFRHIDNILSKLDVKLILVRPDNINKSSLEHGSDLYEHYMWFNHLFNQSSIKDKIIVNQFDIFNNSEHVLEDVLNEVL